MSAGSVVESAEDADARYLKSALATVAPGKPTGYLVFSRPGGELRVRLTVAPSLADHLLPALERRLTEPAGRPTVSLHAWSGTTFPPPPWDPEDYMARDEIRGRTDGRFKASYSVDARILSLLDRSAGSGIFWCPGPGSLRPWDVGAPLRVLLHWALAHHDLHVVHGATAGGPRGAVLFVGHGGTGKSTTTFACLDAGMQTVGDDYCAIDMAQDPPVAHALFDVGKLAPDALARFSWAQAHRRCDAEGKAQVALSAARPGAVTDALPLRAIVLPRIAAETRTPVRVSQADALRALAPSTLQQTPASGRTEMEAMGRLVRALPAYRLDVGPTAHDVSAAVAALVDSEVPA